MTKLSIVWKTLTITKNPLAVLSMKHDKSRKAITFRNGFTCRLTWPQFRSFRDSYPFFTKCAVRQVEDDLFKLEDERSKVVCSSRLVPLLCEFMRDFTIHQEKEDLFHLKNEKLELFGSSGMLVCIQEQRTGEYECDCRGKVVLDIGGFEGESAAYFWMKGAKKVIIYEPVPEHVEFIKRNIALNNIKAEIYQAGIGNKNGTQIIQYNETDPGFGFLCKGLKSMKIKIRDVSEAIEESGAELAKFDCEGAEESLVHVPAETLRKIEYYIIEVHSPEIRRAIFEKFQNADFTLEKETLKPAGFSVLTLKRKTY